MIQNSLSPVYVFGFFFQPQKNTITADKSWNSTAVDLLD